MSEPDAVLIAAASGRALAAAARRSGVRPLVVDFFGDADTRALAERSRRVDDAARGFVADDLLLLLREVAAGETPAGLVYGSGFEDRPDVLNAVAKHYPIFGNAAETVVRAKDPRMLATLCAAAEIPHPAIRFVPPPDPENWLVKRQGGGGGLHIRAAVGADLLPGDYFQRRVAGAPVSVLLLCAGDRAQALGASSQWTAFSPASPFRFGGAVRPARLAPAPLHGLCAAAEEIARRLSLVGLNSVDFLADAGGFHLLEINPRPGATLDIFADCAGRLFAAHVAACRGHLPRRPLIFTKAAATAIAYAPCDLSAMPAVAWPDWCRDRQSPATVLRAGDPVCTIWAEAETAEAARLLVDARRARFENYLSREAEKECAA